MCPHHRRHSTKASLDAAIHAALDELSHCRQSSQAFRRLLQAACSRSALLSARRGPADPESSRRIIGGMVRMARQWPSWVRPPEGWAAPPASPFVQFRSLAGHLFARYAVPNFMAAVWLGGDSEQASWQQGLFLHLGLGRSVRQYRTPIRLTREMARYFMQAPDDLSVELALRWSQVRGLRGEDRLARAVLQTCLAQPTADEPFWESVVRFLVRNEPLSEEEARQIVEFLHRQRFQPAEVVWGRGAGPEPLQPEFSLRGRSLMSLRRHMVHWRDEVRPKPPSLSVQAESVWPRTGIGPFRSSVDGRLWTIDELLTGRELRAEGGIMRHCVATYIPQCARRRTSIWSMRVWEEDRQRRVLTIEVSPATRIIWQAKGKRNAAPDETARSVLLRWARQEGLRFPDAAAIG